MTLFLFARIFFSVALFSHSFAASISSVSQAEWVRFNSSIAGRLHAAVPLGQPCFEQWNKLSAKVDVDACAAVTRNYTSATILTNTFASYGWANFGSCMATGDTCALSYSTNATLRGPVGDTCSLGNIPDFYVDVNEVSDVQAALKFAREKKVPVVVKNSGHDHRGRSSGAGTLAIWVNNYRPALNLTRGFVPTGCSEAVGDAVTMGAGTDFKVLYSFAEANNITVVGGASPTVRPCGGFTAGGGHGPLSTTLGLGVDNALQFETVLPNGTYITANRCQNQDMFFALRGGGGSAFGVNMKLTVKAHPQKRTQLFSFIATARNRTAFRELLHVVSVNSNKWAAAGWGGAIGTGLLGGPLSLGMSLLNIELNATAARESMDALYSFEHSPLLTNSSARIRINETSSFYRSYKYVFGQGDGVMGVGTTISSRLIPKSAVETAEQQSIMTDALAKASEMLAPDSHPRNPIASVSHYPFEMLLVTPAKYKPSTDPNDAVSISPAWRDAVWHVVVKDGILNNASTAAIGSAYKNSYAVTDIFRKMIPNGGAYQNEADLFEPNHEDVFWGKENYARLLRIKREIDPDNLLTCWQCVGFDRKDPRYSCYPDFRP